MFGSSPEQLRLLAAWLLEQEVEEVVMESTAQYWKPVWGTGYWKPIREKREGASGLNATSCAGAFQSRAARAKRISPMPNPAVVVAVTESNPAKHRRSDFRP
jgi:hypothetical protein